MAKIFRSTFLTLLLLTGAYCPLQAYIPRLHRHTTITLADQGLPCETLYRSAHEALERGQYVYACVLFDYVVQNGEGCCATESLFYLALAESYRSEWVHANNALNRYLEFRDSSDHFVEALDLKFDIAEKLRCGARIRVLGRKELPCWASGYSLAVEIYDEIIMAMPTSSLACQALFCKAMLLSTGRQWRESLDCFQFFLRRFPKHELAPTCYVALMHMFFEQARWEGATPEIIALAEVVSKKFVATYPRDERVGAVEATLVALKELHGRYLIEMGRFYERTRHPESAYIYYKSCSLRYPDSYAASICRMRMDIIEERCPAVLEIGCSAAPVSAVDFDLGEDCASVTGVPSDIQF